MKFFIVIFALACAGSTSWAATYQYTGTQYQEALFDDNTSDSITAQAWKRAPLVMMLSLDKPLPDNANDLDLSQAAFDGEFNGKITIDGFEFDIASYSTLDFTTDAVGDIVGWDVEVFGFLGDLPDKSSIKSSSVLGDSVLFENEFSPDGFSFATSKQSAMTSQPGTWAVLPTVPLPVSGILLLTGLLGSRALLNARL